MKIEKIVFKIIFSTGYAAYFHEARTATLDYIQGILADIKPHLISLFEFSN